MENPEVLSVTQVAEALGISRRHVVRRIADGTLTATKLGPGTASYVITRAELERVQSESESVA